MFDRGGEGLRFDRFTRSGVAIASVLLIPAALLPGCTNGIEEAATPVGGASSDEPIAPDCSPHPLDPATTIPSDPLEATVVVSNLVYPVCADMAVLSDFEHLPIAVDQAMSANAPVVLLDAAHTTSATAELDRLDPGLILWAGPAEDRAPTEDLLGIDLDQVPELPIDAKPLGLTAAPALGPDSHVWIAGPAQETTLLASLPAISAGGGTTKLLTDLGPDALAIELAGIPAANATVVSGSDLTDQWRIELALAGTTLPGGGTTLFPDRRIIAFYGSPVTFRLGLLGEQGAQATVDRLGPVVDSYRMGDELLVGGFELIATVADSNPGEDGNYSKELDPEVLREWIDVAAANDIYVIIDLQPGRTDFLTQAKLYEEYLRLPNVGLALDPEWRIGADDVHLVKVGTVDAAEVNTVVDYLVDIVREEKLPQKALVLHQFQTAMITNRELIRTPPELSVVIHVDGQGPLGTKYGTYDTMLGAPIGPEQDLWWGWKNFLDEDTPMATPEQTNAVTPLPVIVTFQ